ncbi:MAG: GNAT family N-acetyltransferase [Acidobacteria bacterium]|nr:MAG: GNAT family N-acetyltransferase [Acidobacteriota bacterium]
MNPNLTIRPATIDDVPAVVQMLADDFLGEQRERPEDPLPESYFEAFREIENDPNNELVVAILDEMIVGTFQLTYTPSLSFQGSTRCTVESVRVDAKLRGQGIGREMMLWAMERAKEKGCVSMQLTTHSERKDAHRFYEGLGFKSTHLGMKLTLE